MKTISLLKILFFLLMTLSIVNCGGGGGGNNPPADVTGSISGVVQSAKDQLPIEGVTVSADGSSVTTSATGSYNLENISTSDRIVVTIKNAGYAEQSKIVSLNKQNQVVDLNVSILPVDSVEEFDPDLSKELTVTDSSAMVMLEASSLVRADGSTPPTGMVISNLTVIDPTTDIDLMPGDMQTDTDGGTLAQIESFGAITATFKDAEGNDLNLATGTPATIRIPVASNTANPPATIPLYFYDKQTGLWVEEGTATLDPTDTFYEGSVTHFSTWNADRVYERVTINGCVEDMDGNRLENIFIYSKGKDYSGVSVAFTDNAGNFSVFAKSDALVSILGRTSFRTTNIVEVQTATSDITLESCLVLQDAPIGNTTGGGTLTLSGTDTATVGTSLAFLDAVNIYSFIDAIYILATKDEAPLGPDSDPTDPDNTFSLITVGDETNSTTLLTITVQAQEFFYFCNTTDIDSNCGNNAITFNTADNSITFTNAVLQRFDFIDNTFITVDITINGTIQWRNYDVFGTL